MTTQVKEHQILFKPEMIQALLAKRKTQTRRVIKPQPDAAWLDWLINTNLQGNNQYWIDGEPTMHLNMEKDFQDKGECPYGQPGDRLWVRETWATADIYNDAAPFEIGNKTSRGISLWYKAGGEKCYKSSTRGRWRASIHMPRWASRFELEVTNIRVERLDDITDEDAMAEGVEAECGYYCDESVGHVDDSYRRPYRKLWDSINGKKYPWDSNPYVWVIEFKQI